MEDDLKMPKVEYLSNNLLDQFKTGNFLQWWMEDDLLKVENLSNHLLDLPLLLNLNPEDQIKIENSCKWSRPPMEVNLKILKVEYTRKALLDLHQLLNLSLGNQAKN